MTVIKRDGREVLFSKYRIVNAISRAYMSVDGKESAIQAMDFANKIADEIENDIEQEEKKVTVEDIQDIVEKKLKKSKRKDVAKAFVSYRNERTKAREYNTEFMKTVGDKLRASDVKNQNANIDEKSFGGRMGEANGTLMKKYALDNIISEMARNNHINNEIYIHDLDSYAVGMHNCLSVPFDDLLANGFTTRQTDVRPAGSVNTAFQLVAVIFQLQSLMEFGGVSATHLDWTMVPYVRKSFYKHFIDGLTYVNCPKGYDTDSFFKYMDEHPDCGIDDEYFNNSNTKDIYQYAMDMTIKETHQAAEGLFHNLNTLQSRSGNQLPFTSINFGTCTLPEGRMIIKELLEVSMEGLGKLHKTPIFPCSIFQCAKGINRKPGDPNYDLFRMALKSTSTRLYPNYANVDWSGNAGYDPNDPKTIFSTMGCRTANGYDINHDPNINGQTKDGRGNICPVTIIMPTLAMEAKEKITDAIMDGPDDGTGDSGSDVVEVFMSLLDQKIHEAKDMLIERFEWICSQSPASARFMYENHTMLGYVPEEGIRSALKHGTLAVGQLGLSETLRILIGCDQTTNKGMELAKRIEQLFKDRCAEFKEQYKLNFGVYYTPAENLCHTAMNKFKDRYGVIDGISDRDYFTNSIHVPVWQKMSPFDKIDIESQLTGYSSAGCITYVELESGIKNNIDALEQIVNYAMDKDIPYFAVNVPNDMCMDCGYTDEIKDVCPQCGGSNIQRLRRVTGLSD